MFSDRLRRYRLRLPQAGLRRRATLGFAAVGLLASTVLATSTYLISRSYLLEQRERSALRQAYAEASYVRDRLSSAGVSPSDVIGDISPRQEARVLAMVDGSWYSSDLTDTSDQLPPELVRAVDTGVPAVAWTTLDGRPAIAVGVPLEAVNAQLFEVSSVAELDRTLEVLRTVLTAVGLATAALTAILGRYVARRVVAPLDHVATAATEIAAGRMDTRLATTSDPDLVAIVASFNTMVDALADRLEREARFTADVSHELRSPLTTLMTGVELLSARGTVLDPRSRKALDLVRQEVDRLHTTLEDLIELARLDALSSQAVPIQADTPPRSATDLVELVRHVVTEDGRDPSLVRVEPDEQSPGVTSAVVLVDRSSVERALLNLLHNADQYAAGPTGLVVTWDESSAYITVDDAGPGVPAAEREQIFGRFARGDSSRGSRGGTGLGLSIVTESIRRHGGSVWCDAAPEGGARFVVRLPLHRDVGHQADGER